jgi:hypothetical protein
MPGTDRSSCDDWWSACQTADVADLARALTLVVSAPGSRTATDAAPAQAGRMARFTVPVRKIATSCELVRGLAVLRARFSNGRRDRAGFRKPDLAGTAIALVTAIMARHLRSTANSESEPIVRWILRRGADAITCEVDVRANRSYDVCVVPHRDVSSSRVERFDAPTAALLRHAEIARGLRQQGWALTDYVTANRRPAAA